MYLYANVEIFFFRESQNIFMNEVVPPTIIMFAQSQERLLGKWSLSSQKFEMPGGWMGTGSARRPRLESINCVLNGDPNPDGFYSTITDKITNQGFLKMAYINIFKMLRYGLYYDHLEHLLLFIFI